jgi:hypothetical protein
LPHDVNLIATIAVGFVLASIFGYLADRLRLPALVGYLVAGIFVGPFTPGFVADTGMAGQLAEMTEVADTRDQEEGAEHHAADQNQCRRRHRTIPPELRPSTASGFGRRGKA